MFNVIWIYLDAACFTRLLCNCVYVFFLVFSAGFFFEVVRLCSSSLESCNEMFVHGIKMPWWPRHGHPDSIIGWPSTMIQANECFAAKKERSTAEKLKIAKEDSTIYVVDHKWDGITNPWRNQQLRKWNDMERPRAKHFLASAPPFTCQPCARIIIQVGSQTLQFCCSTGYVGH